jgi:hypothetical protein
MDNRTAQIGIMTLGIVGALAVICIGVLILVLDNPDIAALAVLASIASAAVGGVAGMVTPRQQAPPPETPARETPVRPSPTESPPTTPPRRPDSG